MAKNPDPALKLATSKGVARTLDDWATMFHLVLVVLPSRPEASEWVPVGERIFATFGDADCHTAFVVTGPASVADRVLGPAVKADMAFVDPDLELVGSLGIERLPAFVHLRQDTSLGTSAEGWDPAEWQQVARDVAKAMSWTCPEVSGKGDPPKFEGWPATP